MGIRVNLVNILASPNVVVRTDQRVFPAAVWSESGSAGKNRTDEYKEKIVMVEEPSYMMFARANVRDNMQTSPRVVKELLERIDRLEAEKKVRDERD
jgi:hypothetical protein